ncbi:MAG: hypothetical protein KatS3mg010_0731 [Acidimicrobiia bacterium]|nr:MAG: hypothetical protein KatS3mg010_0731 [Acidimicrobiia bacterium]
MRVTRRDDGEHPETEVEHLFHLFVGHVAGALHLGEDARHLPAPPAHHRVAPVGQHPHEVAGDPSPRHVRERVHLDLAREPEHRRRVDHARSQQLLREVVVRARPRRAEQVATGPVEQRGACERVAVAAQPGAREPDDAIAGAHPLRQHVRAVDHTDREADEVELAGLHHARVLRHLAAEQRAARLAAALGDPGDELVDLLRNELADRDVVEEEQRLGTLRGDVVDRHGDAVDADRRAPVREPRHERLRADAVGRRHEQRVAVGLPVDREQPAEPADVAHHLGPERRPHVGLDHLDGLLAGRDVDARARVREPILAVAPVHVRSTVPETCRVRSSASSACFVSSSGTGTGYWPLKHAVQNESIGEPVAATTRSRSRYASESTPR